MGLPYEDIAFPRGMNGLNEYSNEVTLYNKGTPIHVKGALIFNHMLKVKGVKSIPPIKDGDKIKFCYLKMPNPYGFTVIATADEIPPEFEIDRFIDREKQFDKGFLEPLKSISDLINWDLQTENTIDAFFA